MKLSRTPLLATFLGCLMALALPDGVTAQQAGVGGEVVVQRLDFRRGDHGEGRVLITLSRNDVTVDVSRDDGKIVATLNNAAISPELLKRLDVTDFATPVKFVDVLRTGREVRIALTPLPETDYEQSAYQAGNEFVLELLPPAEEETATRSEESFSGEPITLSFQNIEIKALLQIIADVAGANIVVSDAVQGTMAMNLNNVPWDQALDIILKSRSLGMVKQGNVMLVAPAEEIAKREKIELESQKSKVELAPLRSEIIQVNYAKAADIKALLSNADNSLLTERGRVSVDDRTNSLLVLETRDKIDEVRSLVKRLDVPVRQVLIESRIVIASEDFARELGTRFGVSTIGSAGSTRIGQSGSGNGARTVVNGGLPGLDDSYIVNLPPTNNPAGRVAWTILGSDFLIDLELSALQQEGRGEVISTPRVVTANGKQALIEQGQEIPYTVASGAIGAAQTQFKKAVLSLTVTPQITPDNRVIMDMAVTNDSRGENINTGIPGGTAPAIDTRKLETQVLIRSGETVVLGGVFQEESNRTQSKVPLLGDIPLLGVLFRSNLRETSKRELLIFVTPKVLQEGLSKP